MKLDMANKKRNKVVRRFLINETVPSDGKFLHGKDEIIETVRDYGYYKLTTTQTVHYLYYEFNK